MRAETNQLFVKDSALDNLTLGGVSYNGSILTVNDSVSVNYVIERSSGYGVTVDGVKMLDADVIVNDTVSGHDTTYCS